MRRSITDQEVRAKVEQAIDRLLAVDRRAVRALYRVEGKRIPRHVGNGVLFQVGERQFVLSAAHVFDELDGGRQVNILSPPTFGGLRGSLHCNRIAAASRPDREDDPFDVAVYAIEKGYRLDGLRGGFLFAKNLDLNDLGGTAGTPYLLLAYRGGKRAERIVDGKVVPEYLSISASLSDPETYRRLGLRPESHLVLDFERNEALTPDGRTVTAPAFKGMSGGGVWRLDSAVHWGRQNPDPLVAVFTTYIERESVIIATRVSAHLEFIRTNHPELSAQIPKSRMWRPLVRSQDALSANSYRSEG